MDQPLDSTLTAIPPAPPPSSVPMSSTDSSPTDSSPPDPAPIPPVARPTPDPASADATSTSAADESPDATSTSAAGESLHESAELQAAARQQPIPPASEPMQYRAIGLIRGKYVASDEQFTRGSIFTDDGYEIGAVLLGRVMSLVKKHVDLEQPHLWVVYPRTREKGDGDLHVQIVGVWEPENLNRMMEASEQEDAAPEPVESDLIDQELESEDAEPTQEDLAAELAEAETEETEETEEAEAENAGMETGEAEGEGEEATIAETVVAQEKTAQEKVFPPGQETQSQPSTPETEVLPPVPASELDDKYFSVRGEVIYQSLEDEQLLVKIRRAPRPGTDESKAFKVVLKGVLEGKAVGYFWDLHVQREGNMLVLQKGTMIAAVPPQKRTRKKPPFNRRGGPGGNRRGGGRPPQGGGPRKPSWQNREGGSLPRPSRSGERSDRPVPPQNRENRPPSPRPVKRRNPEKPEG